MTRIFGKDGPTIADRNLGRDWTKRRGNHAGGKSWPKGGGAKERERAARRLAKAKVQR